MPDPTSCPACAGRGLDPHRHPGAAVSRYPCARCDHTTDSDDHAATHALDTGHLRCIVCQRQSLTVHQAQTCPGCVAAVRADLADLATACTLLEPTSLTAITLLGDGTMQRRPHDHELASLHPSAHPLDHDRSAIPHPIRDEWASDPLPVVAALASWEDFWRADYGDPTGPPATLHGVVSYLTAHLDTGHRAAQTHPAFDEFAAEVRRLRTDVQFTAGLADVPVEAEAECFDCGGPLLRTYEPPAGQVRARREGLPWEGLTADWTCGWCRRVHSVQGYLIGLRIVTSMWVELPLAAKVAHRSPRTVRSWALRGHVGSACRVDDQAVLVWWPDVSDRAFRHADTPSQRSA